jgi:hypothetical protein
MVTSPPKLEMTPATGERLLRFVGDRLRFTLRSVDGQPLPAGWRGLLRTNVGRASVLRREIISSRGGEKPMSGASWRDIPMRREATEWSIELTLVEVGYFKVKAYAVDERGWQVWPEGTDVGISVHPDAYRTANTIYCAFARLFGETRTAGTTASKQSEALLKQLDKQGYTVIPPSGKLRDLAEQLPHIIDTLGCRILHLLPVNPTPTAYARFGRFGSPYAGLDLTAIDPALVEFDRKTTGVEQFQELAYAVHAHGARLFLDLVVNHTGWSSNLHEQHPEWFLRGVDNTFISPGAWGVTWEDLVELDTRERDLWDHLAAAFLTWCRRGVDGFRCDAGYKVPLPVWQYITARVREEFPETLFLLEGLGGGWKETETLLTDGGMQWAYSELFQEISGLQVAGYLDHALKQSQCVGVLAHYSETHDNDRLAKKGRAWSLLRNRLCALASVNGAYGFTCGVEWLAAEKILVHGCASLAWGGEANLIPELAHLNRLMAEHPCFFDAAELTRLSPAGSPVFALQRVSAEGQDAVLVLVNTDAEKPQTLTLSLDHAQERSPANATGEAPQPAGLAFEDLLGQPIPKSKQTSDGKAIFMLDPAACYCLSLPRDIGRRAEASLGTSDALEKPLPGRASSRRVFLPLPEERAAARADVSAQPASMDQPRQVSEPGLPSLSSSESRTPPLDGDSSFGSAYRRTRARAAWAIHALHEYLDPEEIGPHDWRVLAELAARDPKGFLGSLAYLDKRLTSEDLISALSAAGQLEKFPRVVTWSLIDRRRVTLLPPEHWLLVRDDVPFRVTLGSAEGAPASHAESVAVRAGHIACFGPQAGNGDVELVLERYGIIERRVSGVIRMLAPDFTAASVPARLDLASVTHEAKPRVDASPSGPSDRSALVLLTNGIGGMARLCIDLGRVNSKYDCLLAANLNAVVPVDRHVFAKRLRIWANANGFISPLNADNLVRFDPGPPAHWKFAANAGDGRAVEIELTAEMLERANATRLRFWSGSDTLSAPLSAASGKKLGKPADASHSLPVRLTVRVDIEDRNFHYETRRNAAAEHHFSVNTRPLASQPGFAFVPAPDRRLQVVADAGSFHPQAEWCENIPHPVEASRGQVASGDAYSPGWFDLPLAEGKVVALVATAEKDASNPFSSPPMEGNAPSNSARSESPTDGRPTPDPSQEGSRHSAAAYPFPSWEGLGVGSSHNADPSDSFYSRLVRSASAFVVRRGAGKTVIAGYPWFLDWGRDTLICARGLMAAGLWEEVKQIVLTFAQFEENGTLPNIIHGDDASNRDTSDAPLWFGIVCEELAAAFRQFAEGRPARTEDGNAAVRIPAGAEFCSTVVDRRGRTIADVLRSIGLHYHDGTPNGIRMDPESALIWSPSHFTWMDTNFPAGTPREGFPIEIQVLWIRLLRQLERIATKDETASWRALADRAEASLQKYFWLEERGYFADLLVAESGKPASLAAVDTALRSNCLIAISLGLAAGERAQRCVEAARRYLVVPGALRSLAPLPVSPPLPIYGNDGRLLNDPTEPYCGLYEGDEDTRRKPAYHNGTAWTWTFPIFCEALARAWSFSPEATATARAYLGSAERLMNEGCLGQLPEILDGDAPHSQRGCDAQAWGTTEMLRVLKMLGP